MLNVGTTVAKGVVLNFANVHPSLELALPAGCDATSCSAGLVILGDEGLQAIAGYRNCISLEEVAGEVDVGGAAAVCKFDEEFAPGRSSPRSDSPHPVALLVLTSIRRIMKSPEFDGHERARWAGRATAYDRSFARLCAHPATALLDAAGVDKGHRLLDVGTGTGTVAALAHSRGASVLAVDAEPSMLDVAAARLPANATVLATLPVLPFPARIFDATVGNFVINHVGNPAAAVAEMLRVTRPGGRIALTVWPSPSPTAQRLWSEIFDAAGAERPASLPRLDPANDFARTEEGVLTLLEKAGLAEIAATTLTWTLHIHPDDWWAGPAAGLGVPGLIFDHQPSSVIPEIRAAFEDLTAPYLTADGLLALPVKALLTAGSHH